MGLRLGPFHLSPVEDAHKEGDHPARHGVNGVREVGGGGGRQHPAYCPALHPRWAAFPFAATSGTKRSAFPPRQLIRSLCRVVDMPIKYEAA